MASPFRYFRKHTKVFLAVAAVLAIFIFVVGDAISKGGASGDASDATEIVATWKGGKLNAGQLQSLVSQRMLTDQFLGRLFAQGGGESQYDFPPNVPQLLLSRDQANQIEGVVVSTEVLASLATQAGMSVSDSLINHYIQEMGLRRVSGEQVGEILDNIGQGNARANESIVFNMLRKMLLAYFYRRTFDDASYVVLPQERWNDWRKVNERISIEAAVLPVEKFIAETPEPTDAQVTAFYEQYKDADPGRYGMEGGRELPLADPGFAIPRRMRVQYLLGSTTQRTEQMLDKVTEEEIKDYYERNKRLEFTKMNLPGDESFGGAEAESEAATPAESDAAAPAEDGASAPAATGEAPVATPPASSEAKETPAASPAAPEPSAPAEGAPTPTGADTESSSQSAPQSPFRLVAFQQPAGEPAAGDSSSDAEAAPPAAAESAAATQPAGEAAEEAPPAGASPESTPAPAGAAVDPASALPADDDAQYEPLESVREEIRKKLATDKAVQELEKIMGEATAELQAAYSQYTSQVAAAQDAKRKPPAPPASLTDLKWLADKYHLTNEKTTPLTIRELYDTAVGKAVEAASMQMTVTQAAGQSLPLYEPMLARELEGDWYLVNKIEDTARRIPPLKEVRDQVVQAWKRAEAAKLAEKKGKELAAEVTKSGAPFDQFFFAERGFEVLKPTAFFSWRSYPAGQVGMGRPPAVSDVPELKNVAETFMQAAFSLEGKEAVAVPNVDKSAVYVIRLDRRQYSEEELRNLFLKEEGSWLGRADMRFEHAAAFNDAVNTEILEERGQLEFNEEWLAERAKRMQERNN